MATKVRNTILQDARLLLDEQRNNEVLIASEDTISVETDTLLWSFILQAIDEVHLNAQAWLMGDVLTRVDVSLSSRGRTGKKGTLPEDFLRLIRMDASDWAMPVYEPIDPDSEEYMMQSSRWRGARGNQDRPVVAVVPGDTDGSKSLNVEVWETEQDSAHLVYVKRSAIVTDNGQETVTIAEHCYRALLYTLAKHYLFAIGETERAAICGATAGALIGTASQQEETQTQPTTS